MAYAQLDPLVVYKKESFEKFQELISSIINNTALYLMKIDFDLLAQQQQVQATLDITSDEDRAGKVMEILVSATDDLPAQAPSQPVFVQERDERSQLFESDDDVEVFEADETPQVTHPEGKVRPNDPCPCGSGKKYKRCHGK